jgi:hypothetical protein
MSDPKPGENDSDIFRAMDQYHVVVALMSGVRTKFIEHGWSPENAERATISLFGRVADVDR